MRIGFVGLGRVARSFAQGLQRAGHQISPSHDIDAHAQRGWHELGFGAAEDLEKVVQDAEVIFITTPDSAIQSVAASISGLACLGGLKAVFHTSGATSASVLACVNLRAVETGSIHPVMSFSGTADDIERIRGCTFCIEAASEHGLEIAAHLCEQLGADVVTLSGDSKLAHHLACVIASNFAIALMGEALEVHRQAGVPDKASLGMLGHLARAAIENARSLGPGEALTGPFARGDAETIASHVDWMRRNAPSLLPLYSTLGGYTLDLAVRAGRVTNEQADTIREVLGGEDMG